MSQERAFSDTEIITIAAVAAGALGGIIVGLGRGQESNLNPAVDGRRIPEPVSQAFRSGADRARTLSDAELPVDVERIRKRYEDLRPTRGKLAKRAAMRLVVRPALAKAGRRLPERSVRREPSIADRLKALGDSVLETGLDRSTAIDLDALRNEVLASVSRFGKNGAEADDEARDDADGLRARVGEEWDAVESGVADAPDKLRDASARTRKVLRRRVARPVAQAASSTGAASKEALAAVAWLGLGSAIVYFGLLSDERREQVKDALCGAVEQGRLLMLDLQGYEPEM